MTAAAQVCSLRIFIVEDHPDSLKYLSMYLEECGHTISHARGVEEAVATLRKEQCDVLLTDIGLPDGDGWELMKRLRLSRTLPKYAIAMSGFGMNSDRAKSVAAGFRQHLLKPLDPDELDRVLADVMREMNESPELRTQRQEK